MSRGVVIVLSVVGVLATLAAVPGFSYVSAVNTGNRMENNIVAAWENNENILAQYGQKIQEAAQVSTMQADDVAKILTGGLEARYGSDGSQAAFQWIQEQNPNVDSTVYVQIQRIVESGRNDFTAAQTRLVDTKRVYNTALGSFWTGMFMKMADYPNLNTGFRGGTDDYSIISTSRAQTAFEEGKEDGPIKLR